MSTTSSHHAIVNGLKLHWLEAGEGPPLLLLHGWPTSSFLWRNILPHPAPHRRVIAVDLPGFGQSDKPLDIRYNFGFFGDALDGLCDHLALPDTIGLVVHDLGGPIGLWWAAQGRRSLDRLALLNTLVYPKPAWQVNAFVGACQVPGLRALIASPWGLGVCMKAGLSDPARLTAEALAGVREPFQTKPARQALLRAISGLSPRGFETIAAWVRTLTIPVRVIYGVNDRALPDIANTVERLMADIPHAEVTALEDCGHFLQEENPERVGEELAAFFTR